MLKRLLFAGAITLMLCACGSKPKTVEDLIEEDHLVWFDGKGKSPIDSSKDFTENELDPRVVSINHEHWGDFVSTEIVNKEEMYDGEWWNIKVIFHHKKGDYEKLYQLVQTEDGWTVKN